MQMIMEKFLLIIREDLERLRKWNEEQRYNGIREMDKWVKTLVKNGNYISGDALHIKGNYVSKDNVLSDGPFIEAKEAVSGFILINAENTEQAASIAQSCPLVLNGTAVVEVRQIMVVENVSTNG